MEKMKDLELAIEELRTAAESLKKVAGGLTAFLSQSAEPEKPESVTLEKVRGILAEKSRSGLTAEVRVLLEKHGGSKLSEVDPKEYAALLGEAEVLGNE